MYESPPSTHYASPRGLNVRDPKDTTQVIVEDVSTGWYRGTHLMKQTALLQGR